MPNAISARRRSVTYLEDRSTYEALQRLAAERNADVSAILREATAAYCVLGQENIEIVPKLFEERAAAKAAERAETARLIASGELSPADAQLRNSPITQPVRIVNLGEDLRRRARARPAT
jgi:hypothetical protein